MRALSIPVRMVFFLCLLCAARAVLANQPGGGNGSGPAVTLIFNTNASPPTVTMSNGIVTAVIDTYSSQILQLTYNGNQLTGGGTGSTDDINWQGQAPSGVEEGANGILSVIVNPATNNGGFAEICIANLYANHGTTNAYAADAYYYFAMFQGSPGIYVTEDMERNTNAVAGGADIPSLTSQLWGNFNWLGQDNGRFMLRQSPSDPAVGGINNSPKEVTLLTSGLLAGQFECKYDYAGDLNSLHFAGWCSTTLSTNIGLWLIHPSREYFSGGPKHPEIVGQFDMINCTFKSVHFGFGSDLNFTNGETWSRVCGPLFFYCNQVPTGMANPQIPLYADAAAQAAAEAGAWPYTWFTADTNYAQASGRGMVTGQIVINDSGNPNASAAGMWVGLEQQPPSSLNPPTTDFQSFSKNLQFWVQTDTNGNFTIPNVYAGTNYTLLAFGPGAIGLYQSQSFGSPAPPVQLYIPPTPFAVTVTGGQTNNLGAVTWAPTRVGTTVWEMGVPDRDTTEFRHGADYWHGDLGDATNFPVNWAQWQDYNLDYPAGVNFTVGQSRWSADWDYAQPTSLDPTTGNLNGTIQNIFFNLPSAPAGGSQASIYFAVCGDYSGPVEVTVNGTLLNGTGFFPYYDDSDPMIRMESHGIFCDYRLNFAGNLLQAGQNEIQLNMRKGGYFSDSILYDYIRLELTGYVPPTPAGLTAIAGNGVVVLDWPASSGATSYTVSRSTTSGSGYSPIVTNVIGPVVGSDVPDATYTDNAVVNGTPYYYVVAAVNPNGSSTNSVEAAATPSAATPPAPTTPAGLTVTPGNLQATLTWKASPGAATYTIKRTVITAGANANDPGAEAAILPNGSVPTNIVNSFVTTTNYTDTGLANNVLYSYTVSAANANGQSAASAPVSATPSPNFPTPPTGLTAMVSSNLVNLSWNPVAGAEDYVLQRANSASGPYTTVDYPDWLSTFSDTGLAYNTTYYYEVASANLAGISSNSAPLAVTLGPAPPSPVSAVPGNAQVFVSWGASVDATNYVLQRSMTSGGPYTTIISTTNTSYLDTMVNNGTIYYYVVYATGPNGQSPLSAQATAMPSAQLQMIKSDTTTMDTAADWSGVAPATNEVGIFNNIISAANEAALTLGGNVDVGGLIFSNNLNGPVSVASGNTLTLEGSGINLSVANQNATFNNAISLDAAQIWNIGSGRTITLNGAVTETASGNGIIKIGTGTLAISGSSSFADGITANQGTVSVTGGTMPIILNGGTFFVGAALSTPVNVTANGGIITLSANRTLSGTFTGSGTANVNNPSSGQTLSFGADVFSGFSGEIEMGTSVGGIRWNSSSFTGGNNASFDLGTSTAYITRNNSAATVNLGALFGGSGTTITGGGTTYAIGGKNINCTFSGNIESTASVIKNGTATLTLNGANTYNGGTTINSGTLLANNSSGSGTGSGNVIVANGGTLGGTGAISGAVTVNSGGALAPGNPPGALAIGNNLALAAGSMTFMQIEQSPLTNTAVNVTGTLTEGGTLVVSNIGATALTNGDSFKLFNATAYSGAFGSLVLPPLPAGLGWNTGSLATNGTLSVVVAAKPVFASVSISGIGFAFAGTDGVANANYYLLGSTNLATPRTNWTRLLTNQFDNNGNFDFTNVVGTNSPGFYLLQLQ